MAALSTRSGSIGKDNLDDDDLLPYITYGDATLKLVGGDRIEDVQAQVAMRSMKGENLVKKRTSNHAIIPHVQVKDNLSTMVDVQPGVVTNEL